ncbi:MAG: hypothetical protein QG574_5006 [Cyanobacteriota bacterium erpe_2018_sw_21hr_WHONDRS-SW48-000092_B_bin.40]|jgi:hypothetical protein|nr:hypothetical protein [Cyanobacteriota bacterium erpe_2018_sw_21hr_WHONDRS-SW48-000092_B_bin.40]
MTDDKKALRDFVASARALARKKTAKPAQAEDNAATDNTVEEELVCCKGIVHIAYRGIADDRMYLSYSRQWNEIRFFRPHGLRVFCADCRHRVL